MTTKTNNLLMNKNNMNTKKTTKTKAKTTSKKVVAKPAEKLPENSSVEASGELLNTSELSMRYGIDRSVVRKRLRLALIEPHSRKANETVYLVNEDLEEALIDEGNPELDAARLRKLTVETELKMIELKVKNGEYGSVLDFSAEVFKLIRGLHRKCTITLPRTLAKKLARMKDEMQISQLLAGEYDGVFQEAREDHDKRMEKQFGAAAKN